MKRVAIIEVSQESNSFCYVTCKLKDFQNVYFYYGKEVLENLNTATTEVGGFLNILNDESVEIVPIIATRAFSSGPVEQNAIDKFVKEIVSRLKVAGKLDGVLVALHGAMLGVNDYDPEGHILEVIRKSVGNDIPIVATMDLHANVTDKKIKSSTAIIGFRHYPHDDTFETGQRAALLLIRILKEKIKPVMAMSKIPMLVPCNNSETNSGPMGEIVAEEHRMEEDKDILSVSSFPVQPWLDIPGTGFTSIVITNNNPAKAKVKSERLVKMAWELKKGFEVKTFQVKEAIQLALKATEKTVLLVDTADAPGGGSTGDSTAVLECLLKAEVKERSFLSIVDPHAADIAASAGVGKKISLTVGNRIDTRRGEPIKVEGIVTSISDGRFLYKGLFGGTWGNMGLSVVLKIGEIYLLISSLATYEWDDVQYRCAGLSVEDAKIVVIKNPINFKFTFKDITEKVFILDTPGPCNPHLTGYNFERISHPLYPFDKVKDLDVYTTLNR